jgi:hypothetical protein
MTCQPYHSELRARRAWIGRPRIAVLSSPAVRRATVDPSVMTELRRATPRPRPRLSSSRTTSLPLQRSEPRQNVPSVPHDWAGRATYSANWLDKLFGPTR